MSYRPITDFWFLTRAKLKDGKKYYGAYLGGFPERARVLIGASLSEPVLHVCGGMAKFYPYQRGIGKLDKTLDLDRDLSPDYWQDATQVLPQDTEWAGILIDPPYSPEDATHYRTGAQHYPSPNILIKNALQALPVGKKVGIIHYSIPGMPKNAVFVACAAVACGFNNRIRVFSVFEKI